MKQYDYIVIGGGTTGCVMASRLSENSAIEVLLLEAGQSFDGQDKPQVLQDSRLPVLSGFNWDIQANVQTSTMKSLSKQMQRAAGVMAVASGRLNMMKASVSNLLDGKNIISKFQYPLAKVIGGGSSINGALSMIPPPADFAQWSAVDGWAWPQFAPYYQRFLSAQTGAALLNIEIDTLADLCPVQKGFYDACVNSGFAPVDLSQPEAFGVGVIPKNTIDGRRQSADLTHLAVARQRANLTVLSNCVVDKLICAKGQTSVSATGVQVTVDGKRDTFNAKQIVLSAGAVHSPAVLLRSGIGDANALRALGIEPILDLPGVGENLIDHPTVSIWAQPKAGMSDPSEPIHQVMLRLKDASQDRRADDLQLFMLGALHTRLFPPLDKIVESPTAMAISVMLGKPTSTGQVKLLSQSPEVAPCVNINCLNNPDDLMRMKIGVRQAWQIGQQPGVRKNIEQFVMWNQGIMDSEKALDNMIQTTARASFHPVGTLKMGSDSDPMAVTDGQGKLRGCDNITVADASIMPTITTVPPNLTCMAIGEKISSHLGASH